MTRGGAAPPSGVASLSSTRRVVTALVFVGAVVAACGGKVEVTDSAGLATATPGGGTSSGGRHPTTGPRPSRTVSGAVFADDVAENYCKTFSSCCVGMGQPPIDVSRCRTLVQATVTSALGNAPTSFDLDTETACVEVIRERIAACAKSDVAWPLTASGPALFAPTNVQLACNSLLGLPPAAQPGPQPCSVSSGGCAKSATCAVDECTTDPALGVSCGMTPCLDGLTCASGTCAMPPIVQAGAPCTSDTDCVLGLGCTADTHVCTPARQLMTPTKERSSPYRVGADTCGAFNFL